MLKYGIVIYWSEGDAAFLAEIPELPGCRADGQTYQEALANAETVMKQWTEIATETGRRIPRPKGRLMFI